MKNKLEQEQQNNKKLEGELDQANTLKTELQKVKNELKQEQQKNKQLEGELDHRERMDG